MPDEKMFEEAGYSKREIDSDNDGRTDGSVYSLIDNKTGASTSVGFIIGEDGSSIFHSATFSSCNENGDLLENEYIDTNSDGIFDTYIETEYDKNNTPYYTFIAEDDNHDGNFDAQRTSSHQADGQIDYLTINLDVDMDGHYDFYSDTEYQYENGVLIKESKNSYREINDTNSEDEQNPKNRQRIIKINGNTYYDETGRAILSENNIVDSSQGKRIEYESYSYNEDGSYIRETKIDRKCNKTIDSIVVSNFNSDNSLLSTYSKQDRNSDGFFEIEEAMFYENGKMISRENRSDKNQDGNADETTRIIYDENGERSKISKETDLNYDGIVDKYENETLNNDGTSKNIIRIDDDFDGQIDATTYRYYKDGELIRGEHFEDYDINKQIDSFKQGRNGDCWFLAGINALQNTAQGRKIIENAIEINDDETYTVNFAGVGKSYTITQDDLNQTRINNFASGDDDILLLEAAAIKFFEENPHFLRQIDPCRVENSQDEINPMLDGGNFEYITYLFLGEGAIWTKGDAQENEFLNMYEENQANISAEISFWGGNEENPYTMLDVEGNEIKLGNQHAWTLKSIDGEEVTMVNPWNSDEEAVVYKDDLVEKADRFIYKEFSQEKNPKVFFRSL